MARPAPAGPAPLRPELATPALYECAIRHVRSAPVRNAFCYRTYQWLVDVDQLPELPRWLRPLASFRSSDHLGDPRRPLRQNIETFLAGKGLDITGGRIVMLASARVFGYVFNPLSVYWCYRPDGSRACVLAEVHNTYGQRYCYLLDADERGRARADKAFYVSPFNPVDGHYQMALPEPGERLSLSITLHRPGAPPFVASVRGLRRDATARELMRAALRHPWPTAATIARIHAQGIKLWARGLPVARRPAYHPQKGI